MNEFDSGSKFSGDGGSGYDVKWIYINYEKVHINGDEGDKYLKQVNTNYFTRDSMTTFNLIRVAQVFINHIPRAIKKYCRLRRIEQGCRSAPLKLFDVTVKRIATILFPDDGRGLFSVY